MANHLHIISLDIPWPADYGGVIDIFYKIKALHQLGIRIHLHCFYAKRGPSPELEKYCEKVYYYPRSMYRVSLYKSTPFIVSSRQHTQLLQNLSADKYPVLFEGIHTTNAIYAIQQQGHACIIRAHNVEHQYYAMLARHEKSFFKKQYFRQESRRLKKYEKHIAHDFPLLCISPADTEMFSALQPAAQLHYLPAFIPQQKIESHTGMGRYLLYHGNLSINENAEAVQWLIEEVLKHCDNIPCIIAGKHPSNTLKAFIGTLKNTTLIENPDHKQMQQLIEEAHIHLLPAKNNTGIKLKLLNALFSGRHIITDIACTGGDKAVAGACTIASNGNQYIDAINMLMKKPFTEEDRRQRAFVLDTYFNNNSNAATILPYLY